MVLSFITARGSQSTWAGHHSLFLRDAGGGGGAADGGYEACKIEQSREIKTNLSTFDSGSGMTGGGW